MGKAQPRPQARYVPLSGHSPLIDTTLALSITEGIKRRLSSVALTGLGLTLTVTLILTSTLTLTKPQTAYIVASLAWVRIPLFQNLDLTLTLSLLWRATLCNLAVHPAERNTDGILERENVDVEDYLLDFRLPRARCERVLRCSGLGMVQIQAPH